MSIPNVSQNKLLFELSVLLTVIGLIFGTAYYTWLFVVHIIIILKIQKIKDGPNLRNVI
jgi:hypothetical protein